MSETTHPTTYNSRQMLAHWMIAFLVVFQFLTGDGMAAAFNASIEDGASMVAGPAIIHGGLGLTVLALMLWRVTLRLRFGAPPPPETEPERLQYLSRGVHYAFYVLLIGMPIAGLLAILTGSGLLAISHAWASKLVIVLAVLHVAGACWHLWKRDGVVSRILRDDPPRMN